MDLRNLSSIQMLSNNLLLRLIRIFGRLKGVQQMKKLQYYLLNLLLRISSLIQFTLTAKIQSTSC